MTQHIWVVSLLGLLRVALLLSILARALQGRLQMFPPRVSPGAECWGGVDVYSAREQNAFLQGLPSFAPSSCESLVAQVLTDSWHLQSLWWGGWVSPCNAGVFVCICLMTREAEYPSYGFGHSDPVLSKCFGPFFPTGCSSLSRSVASLCLPITPDSKDVCVLGMRSWLGRSVNVSCVVASAVS